VWVILGGQHIAELSKYLAHKRMLEVKKLKSEQRKYLHSGLVVDSMGHETLKDQGNEMLITQVAHTSGSKQKLGLQRKTILDVESSKSLQYTVMVIGFLINSDSWHQTL
jgi:hypothetical protein